MKKGKPLLLESLGAGGRPRSQNLTAAHSKIHYFFLIPSDLFFSCAQAKTCPYLRPVDKTPRGSSIFNVAIR